jgi:intracellular multiplication protein IcmJ
MIPEISLSVCRDLRRMPLLAHTSRKDEASKRLREMVIAQGRFGRRCYYCDFSFGSSDLFEVHNLDHDHQNEDPGNVVPVCEMCHAPFHLDLVARKWPGDTGKIIFLPELTQPELNNLLQAVFYAMAVNTAGEENKSNDKPQIQPHTIYMKLADRAELVERSGRGGVVRAGLSEPYALSRVLADMDDATYARRDQLLYGLRYLAPQTHFVTQAQAWNGNECAFSRLDLAAWPSIAE